MPGWMMHSLESRLSGEISVTSDNGDDTTLTWMEEPGRLPSTGLQRVGHDWATLLIYLLMEESEEELKNLLIKVKEGSKKLD